jgi:hypothetical protein
VISANLTQASNGLAGWVTADVVKVLSEGKDKDNMPLCPPMPFGPLGAFGGMDAAHKEAIGVYITSLPADVNPSDGGRFPMCIMPMPPDGGMPDASMPDSSTPMDAGNDGG